MPNHCENRMHFYIPDNPARAAEVLDKIGAVNEEDTFLVDFGKLIPMPDILRRTRSGHRLFEVDGETICVRVWISEEEYHLPSKGERMLTPEEEAEIASYGATSWHDWSCDNWGTKWNAYDQNNTAEEDGALLVFNTAWGPPEPWIAKLRETFPDVRFHGVYVIEFNEAAGML